MDDAILRTSTRAYCAAARDYANDTFETQEFWVLGLGAIGTGGFKDRPGIIVTMDMFNPKRMSNHLSPGYCSLI